MAMASVTLSLSLALRIGSPCSATSENSPAMASSLPLPAVRAPAVGKPSPWRRATPQILLAPGHPSPNPSASRSSSSRPSAKLRLSEIMGGRGLLGGEEGLGKFLESPLPPPEESPPPPSPSPESTSPGDIPDDGFEKELMGFTGGFPGGEKGLEKFIRENPPPPKKRAGEGKSTALASAAKPKLPELPLLMPGMIVIVKNPSNPFYMYCGIVQRVTDGMAGVLFEGGNWDKLLTFRLDELERREKGPPMVNPRSAVLESPVEESPPT